MCVDVSSVAEQCELFLMLEWHDLWDRIIKNPKCTY